MKKIGIIVNRAAGRGRAVAALQESKRVLWGWAIDYFSPESSEQLTAICRGLDPASYEAAIVIGGDGTINHAIRGLARKGVPLLPFPGGTANDLAHELGITGSWEQVQRLVDGRSFEPMDLIDVNGTPFATVAGMGVGAILTAELNHRRKGSFIVKELLNQLRSEIYTFLSAKTVLMRRDYVHRVRIKSNVFDERMKTPAVFICNQRYLGGNLKVAHRSDNDDEMFTVLVAPQQSALKLLGSLVKLKSGKLSHKDFILFSTKHLVIQDLEDRSILIFGDGETLVETTTAEFRILPLGIRVYRERAK